MSSSFTSNADYFHANTCMKCKLDLTLSVVVVSSLSNCMLWFDLSIWQRFSEPNFRKATQCGHLDTSNCTYKWPNAHCDPHTQKVPLCSAVLSCTHYQTSYHTDNSVRILDNHLQIVIFYFIYTHAFQIVRVLDLNEKKYTVTSNKKYFRSV